MATTATPATAPTRTRRRRSAARRLSSPPSPPPRPRRPRDRVPPGRPRRPAGDRPPRPRRPPLRAARARTPLRLAPRVVSVPFRRRRPSGAASLCSFAAARTAACRSRSAASASSRFCAAAAAATFAAAKRWRSASAASAAARSRSASAAAVSAAKRSRSALAAAAACRSRSASAATASAANRSCSASAASSAARWRSAAAASAASAFAFCLGGRFGLSSLAARLRPLPLVDLASLPLGFSGCRSFGRCLFRWRSASAASGAKRLGLTARDLDGPRIDRRATSSGRGYPETDSGGHVHGPRRRLLGRGRSGESAARGFAGTRLRPSRPHVAATGPTSKSRPSVTRMNRTGVPHSMSLLSAKIAIRAWLSGCRPGGPSASAA